MCGVVIICLAAVCTSVGGEQVLALISGGTLMGFAGFICCFHRALCSVIFCVAQAADTPIASVTLAVPAKATLSR